MNREVPGPEMSMHKEVPKSMEEKIREYFQSEPIMMVPRPEVLARLSPEEQKAIRMETERSFMKVIDMSVKATGENIPQDLRDLLDGRIDTFRATREAFIDASKAAEEIRVATIENKYQENLQRANKELDASIGIEPEGDRKSKIKRRAA